MHAFITFFVLLFSSPHTAPAAHNTFVPPDSRTSDVSETTPSRDEVARLRDRSFYAGTGCTNCRRTTVTSNER
jgi:hypothetical protein